MRNGILAAALAATMVMGCSGSGSSSSSSGSGSTGSTSTSTTTGSSSTGSTAASSSSSSSSTTGNPGSSSTTVGTSGSGSTTTTGSGSTSTSGSTGSGSTTGTAQDWSCLGHETAPTPASSSAALKLTFQDALGTANVGFSVKLYKLTDTSMTTPDATGTTDANGAVTLTVPLSGAAYEGLVDVTDPTQGTPETLVYLPPIASDLSIGVKTISSSDFSTLGSLYGRPDFANHGIVDGNIADCTATSASGATVSVTPAEETDGGSTNTTVYYLQSSGIPNGTSATDSSGNYLVTNVPPSAAETVDTKNSAGTAVGAYSVIVKKAAITTIIGVPNK